MTTGAEIQTLFGAIAMTLASGLIALCLGAIALRHTGGRR